MPLPRPHWLHAYEHQQMYVDKQLADFGAPDALKRLAEYRIADAQHRTAVAEALLAEAAEARAVAAGAPPSLVRDAAATADQPPEAPEQALKKPTVTASPATSHQKKRGRPEGNASERDRIAEGMIAEIKDGTLECCQRANGSFALKPPGDKAAPFTLEELQLRYKARKDSVGRALRHVDFRQIPKK